MSMNRYMHPRNIYKSPPDFKKLAIEYPEFRNHVKQDITGKITIDFKDVAALRSLTCTLLKKDFNLDVEIPLNKLIPTVPLRLNYVLWIEDLLSISAGIDNVRGIDIGAGASCIYPLLAAKLHRWHMLATEVDKDSIKYANANVVQNSLDSLITVQQVSGDTLLLEAIGDSSEQYDFCMCNPPFFSTPQETQCFFKSRKESRPRPRNAFCASLGEVVAKGGEVEFITKLIEESKLLNNKIRIYTSMVGHKSSLVPLKKLLREANVVSFKQTEFCQGHTTRWGLAWTFCDIDLRKVPEHTLAASRKMKPKVPFQYVLPGNGESAFDIEEVAQKLRTIVSEISITLEEIKHSKNVIAYNFIATKNTWSHQRRKRREKRRVSTLLTDPNEEENSPKTKSPESSFEDNKMEVNHTETTSTVQNQPPPDCTCEDGSEERMSTPDIENALNKLAEVNVTSPGSAKREFEDDDCEDYYKSKRAKITNDGCGCHQNEFYIKGLLVVRRHEESQLCIELSWIEGSENREILHQILQYVKNNLKLT